MKRVRWTLLLVLSLCFVLVVAACGNGSGTDETATDSTNGEENADNGSNGDVLTLKLGHQAQETTSFHQLAVKFKEIVEEKADGRVEIEIYPQGQLGSNRELMEAMQFGNLDFGVVSTPPLSGFTSEYMVLDLPFIFEDWDHVERWLASDNAQELLTVTDKVSMKSLSFMALGTKQITNSKLPINTPSDLEGLDIRVIETPITVQSYEAFGANVRSMNWPDTYIALEQGAIDGQGNPLDIIYNEKVFEVNNYLSKASMNFSFAVLTSSKDNFEALPEDIQEIMIEAAQEAADYMNPINREEEGNYEALLKEEGMTINEVDREPFKEHVSEVYEEFINEYGDKYFNGIEETR